jgi:hypothetical protein
MRSRRFHTDIENYQGFLPKDGERYCHGELKHADYSKSLNARRCATNWERD